MNEELSLSEGDAYPALLSRLAELHPRLAQGLCQAERSRRGDLEMLLGGVRLRGLDELMRHLDLVEVGFEREPSLQDIAFLVRRLTLDFETALEASLSSYVGVASDAMRDVMEIEMLFLDFALDAAKIQEWLNADARTRREQFTPAKIRNRLRAASIGRFGSPGDDGDYRAHSEALHVSPRRSLLVQRGLATDEVLLGADAGFWEIFFHGRRIVVAIDTLYNKLAPAGLEIPRPAELEVFGLAYGRTQEMEAQRLAIVGAPVELREELGREPTTVELRRRVQGIQGQPFSLIEDLTEELGREPTPQEINNRTKEIEESILIMRAELGHDPTPDEVRNDVRHGGIR